MHLRSPCSWLLILCSFLVFRGSHADEGSDAAPLKRFVSISDPHPVPGRSGTICPSCSRSRYTECGSIWSTTSSTARSMPAWSDRVARRRSSGLATVPWDNVAEGRLARMLFAAGARGEGQGRELGAAGALPQDHGGLERLAGVLRALRGQPPAAGALPGIAGGVGRWRRPRLRPAGQGNKKRLRGLGQVYATARTGMLGTAIRTFHTAYVQRAWGTGRRRPVASEARRLAHRGEHPVKVHDVKNAGRSQLHEHVSPVTPEVMAFLTVVKARFPGLETERLWWE